MRTPTHVKEMEMRPVSSKMSKLQKAQSVAMEGWKGALNMADSATPLNVRQSHISVKMLVIFSLAASFTGAFIYSIVTSREKCTEKSGCLQCTILNEESADNYRVSTDGVVRKDKLGIRTQSMQSSCTNVDFNPASRTNIGWFDLSDAQWDEMITDFVQMNLYFLQNDCDYVSDCNQYEWKSCDGGIGNEAFTFSAYGDSSSFAFNGPKGQVTTTEVLTKILTDVKTRAKVFKLFKFDDDGILADIDKPPKPYKSLRAYMQAGLGYSNVQENLEMIDIKETMMMVCHLHSLRIFAARLYVASKLSQFVENECAVKVQDDRKISSFAVQSVLDNYGVDNRNFWLTYFKPLYEAYHNEDGIILTENLRTNCAAHVALKSFTATHFEKYIDSDTSSTDLSESSLLCSDRRRQLQGGDDDYGGGGGDDYGSGGGGEDYGSGGNDDTGGATDDAEIGRADCSGREKESE